MQIDNISFNDISIFHPEEEFSIFHKLNFTRTLGGKEWLRKYFTEPHSDLKKIIGTQKVIRTLMEHVNEWPTDITNGTVLVMDKFMDYHLTRSVSIRLIIIFYTDGCTVKITPWLNFRYRTLLIFSGD